MLRYSRSSSLQLMINDNYVFSTHSLTHLQLRQAEEDTEAADRDAEAVHAILNAQVSANATLTARVAELERQFASKVCRMVLCLYPCLISHCSTRYMLFGGVDSALLLF